MVSHSWDSYPHAVLLTLYTNSVLGQLTADGSVKPTFVNRLTWAVIYRTVPIVSFGGPIRLDPAPMPAPAPLCDFVFLVGADTGSCLDAFSQCPGRL